MKNHDSPPILIHCFSCIQQNTSTKSAIIAKPAKRNKKATLMQKQTSQQNICLCCRNEKKVERHKNMGQKKEQTVNNSGKNQETTTR